MDVMRPEIIWVDGCCFRINFVVPSSCKAEKVSNKLPNVHECDDESDFGSFVSSENCHITFDDSGKYTAALNLASAYFPVIIGAKGVTRKRLEAETRTHIQIPKIGQDGIIKIKGNDQKGVISACRRISLIVMSFRQRQPFTHFVSVSVAGKEIQKAFLQFKKEVMESCKNCVSESLFQREQKLHITFGTVVLLDNIEREGAAQALQGAYTEVVRPLLEGRSLKVHIKGLEYMNDDPSEVDVLYAKVLLSTDGGSAAGCSILQDVADGVVDYFSLRGLMKKEYEKVKLHVTLMNTLFRKEDVVGSEHAISNKEKARRRDSFDATSILKNFQEYDFGMTVINSIQLSQRYSSGKDGYYQCTAKVELT